MNKNTDTVGVCSLASGIVGIVFCWMPMLSAIPGALALILYWKSEKTGMAKAGLVLGIITLVIQALIILSIFLLGGILASLD